MDDKLLTVEDLAAHLGIPKATIYAWNSRNLGPRRIRVGKWVRYREVDVVRWLEEQTVE